MKNTSKKIVAGLMVTGMLAAAALPTFAEGETKDMTVEYKQVTTYTLKIPSTITLQADTEVDDFVGLSAVNTAPDKKVQVKVKAGAGNVDVTGSTLTVELTRENDTETKVVSTVTGTEGALGETLVVAEYHGYAVSEGGVIADDTLTSGGKLFFTKVTDSSDTVQIPVAVKAGSYTGTMVFEGTVEDYAPTPQVSTVPSYVAE